MYEPAIGSDIMQTSTHQRALRPFLLTLGPMFCSFDRFFIFLFGRSLIHPEVLSHLLQVNSIVELNLPKEAQITL